MLLLSAMLPDLTSQLNGLRMAPQLRPQRGSNPNLLTQPTHSILPMSQPRTLVNMWSKLVIPHPNLLLKYKVMKLSINEKNFQLPALGYMYAIGVFL